MLGNTPNAAELLAFYHLALLTLEDVTLHSLRRSALLI